MDFDYQFDMPSQDEYGYQPYDTGGVDVGNDPWTSYWGGAGQSLLPDYDFGANQQSFTPQAQDFQPQQQELPFYDEQTAAPQWTPPSMGQTQAPQLGQMGGGPGSKEEESWLSRLAKAGFGMGVGAGTTALGSMAQNALAPKEKSSSPAAASQGAAATPTALPAAPTPLTYTPQALEPLPGTKASPLISGRPTTVKGSAGLKERRPQNGGFTMY